MLSRDKMKNLPVTWAEKGLGLLEKWFSIASGSIAFALMIIIILQIVALRIGVVVPGVFEGSQLLMVGMVFLGLAYTQSVRGHIGVDLLTKRVTPRWRRVLEIFELVLALGIYGIMTYSSGIDTYLSWRTGDFYQGLIAFPIWPGKAFVPIGAGVLCLRLLDQLVRASLSGKVTNS